MKKTLILLFVAALGAGTMSSCKKSSKGKMTGDWTVSSMSVTGSNTVAGTSGYTSSFTSTNDGTTTTETETTTPTSTGIATTTTETYSESTTYSILKDGTYSSTTTTVKTSVNDLQPVSTDVMQNVTTTSVTNESGTWSFVKKNKSADLGTNERVVFNETSSDGNTTVVSVNTALGTTAGYTAGTTSSTWSSADDAGYMGNSMIATISESKKKTLTFIGSNSTSNNSSSTDMSGVTTTAPLVTGTEDWDMTMTQD